MSEMSEIIKTCDNCGHRSNNSPFSTRGIVVCRGPKECKNYSHWKPDLPTLEAENAELKSELERLKREIYYLQEPYGPDIN